MIGTGNCEEEHTCQVRTERDGSAGWVIACLSQRWNAAAWLCCRRDDGRLGGDADEE